MKIRVDVDKCIAAGQCVRVASSVFQQDDETGLVVVLQESPPDELLAQVKNAARICPAKVIEIDAD